MSIRTQAEILAWACFTAAALVLIALIAGG
jgi:hypothetical protein